MQRVITNTTKVDLSTVHALFDQVLTTYGTLGYRIWDAIDTNSIVRDIEEVLQYKIMDAGQIICVFSIQLRDELIWREMEKDNALYIHRAVVHPQHRGRRFFQEILRWAIKAAHDLDRQYIRLDTWADNERLINYYKSFGFSYVAHYTTPNSPDIAIQYRDLPVVLLEMQV